MIPPIATIPAITITSPQFVDHSTSTTQTASSKFSARTGANRVSISSQTNPVPLTSPEINSISAPKLIAQSELPGGSTPTPSQVVPPPPPTTTTDTGGGYPLQFPKNYFGPAVGFGNGAAAYGVITRFHFADNFSLRPSAVFNSNGSVVRLPITYDFSLGQKEPFERNPLINFNAGAGVQYASGGNNGQGSKFDILGTVGADVNLFEGVAAVISFNTNFGSINGTNLGLGFEF
ncbi:MAG: hypothetical protein RLZZ135_467 [Cyanobacteriota bacterium]|jgi:hypothetical protein